MPFSQIILPSPSPTESKRLFCTLVSLLLSHMQGYHYHLSKFHIYALVYCIGVFLSGLLHPVYTGCPKLLQNHWYWYLITHYWTLHCIPEKKSSSTHQNTDTSFPNQETLTSHLYNPTHSEETPQKRELHKLPEYRKVTQTQQYKQDKEAEKYPSGKGTG